MNNYTSSQKLWRIVYEPTGYYYEIRLKGMTIDRIKIEEPVLSYLSQEHIIQEINYETTK